MASNSSCSSSQVSSEDTIAKRGKSSYVWCHFTIHGDKTVCSVVLSSGKVCGKALARDKTSSTKAMSDHLQRLHGLYNPKLAEQSNQTSLEGSFKRIKTQHVLALNTETLKTAISYFIAEADLPFALINRQSFKHLLKLCNPQTAGMIVKRHTIARHTISMFQFFQNYIKNNVFNKAKYISFTQDGWTSPNQRAYMSITAHFITDNFELKSLTIGIPRVSGQHVASNYADLFVKYLIKYNIVDSLSTITADNENKNGKIAKLIHESPEIKNFNPIESLFGCVAHVINLAAHKGLDVFGVVEDALVNPSDASSGPMDLANLVDRSDSSTANLSTIRSRCHGLVVWVRSSPQRSEAFSKIVKLLRSISLDSTDPADPTDETEVNTALQFLAPEPTENVDEIDPISQGTAVALIPDVETRWNSTFLMFRRLLRLRKAVQQFCERPGATKFQLTDVEWTYVEQMCNFLEPLSEATNELCRSRFPTLHTVIPIYIAVMGRLNNVISTYDNHHLIPAARVMIEKLETYFKNVLLKPGAVCATILDPRLKMSFFEAKSEVLDRYDTSPAKLKDMFCSEALKFESPNEVAHQASKTTSQSYFGAEIYGTTIGPASFESELSRYLSDLVEPADADILLYWKSKVKSYPILSQMAMKYLAIPATSAPSEGAFSKTKVILTPQRSKLSDLSVEALLCLKEWYRVFGPLFVSPGCQAEPIAIID